MTTKTTEKTEPKTRSTAPSQEEMQAAYQCHTLAQILFGRIAATHPWLFQTPPTSAPVQPGVRASGQSTRTWPHFG